MNIILFLVIDIFRLCVVDIFLGLNFVIFIIYVIFFYGDKTRIRANLFFFIFTFSPPNANCFFSPVFAFFSLLHRLITPLPSPFLLLFQSLPSIPSSSPLLFRHHHQHFRSSSSWLLLSLSQLIHHLHHQRFPPPASVLLLWIDAISSLIISSPSLLLWISVWLSLLCYRCCCLLLPLAVSIFIDCCW